MVKTPMASSNDEIFLVDGSGYIFRAYFALPPLTHNGMPVGAVLGFSSMLMKMLKDLNAPYIAVIFDAAKKNFRYDIYEDYKANREEAPEDLIPQFPLFRKASEAFGIPAIEVEGFEADDLIATYARCAREQGRKVTIVGTDKDLMQLVNDDVRLYDPIKNKYLGADDVFEKFGVQPDKVVDVQALSGDSVDNVPGVPGIGIKTAAQLINEYGTENDAGPRNQMIAIINLLKARNLIDGIGIQFPSEQGSVLGLFFDTSLRVGYSPTQFIETFLNLRYLGGGARGPGSRALSSEFGDGYNNNFIHAMTLSIGFGVK